MVIGFREIYIKKISGGLNQSGVLEAFMWAEFPLDARNVDLFPCSFNPSSTQFQQVELRFNTTSQPVTYNLCFITLSFSSDWRARVANGNVIVAWNLDAAQYWVGARRLVLILPLQVPACLLL